MADINLKKKEAKTIKLTCKDKYGSVVDVSTGTFTFVIKATISEDALVTIADGDFDKTLASVGIITFVLTDTHTNRTGAFIAELKIVFSATNIDKSGTLTVKIEEALIS